MNIYIYVSAYGILFIKNSSNKTVICVSMYPPKIRTLFRKLLVIYPLEKTAKTAKHRSAEDFYSIHVSGKWLSGYHDTCENINFDENKTLHRNCQLNSSDKKSSPIVYIRKMAIWLPCQQQRYTNISEIRLLCKKLGG